MLKGATVLSDAESARAAQSIYGAAITSSTDLIGASLPGFGLGGTLNWNDKVLTLTKGADVLTDNLASDPNFIPTELEDVLFLKRVIE